MKSIKAIENYINTIPGAATRAVALRELNFVNKVKPLNQWRSEDAISHLRGVQQKLQPSTVSLRMNRLRCFFNYMIENKIYSGANPISKKIIPKYRDICEPQVLTKNEVDLFIKQIPKNTWLGNRDRCAVAMQLIHGLRVGSVLAMNWDDLEQRGQDWFLYTRGKGLVTGSRKLRPDVVRQLSKFHKLTFGMELK